MADNQYRTVVARHHPRRRQLQILTLALIGAVVMVVGFFVGQQAAYSGMGVNPEIYRDTLAANEAYDVAIETLERDLQLARDRTEMDTSALELVRQELAEQRAEIADLEEAVSFYKGIMAPESLPRGLSLRPVELVPGVAPNTYGFRIVAQQEARKHGTLIGNLQVSVEGQLQGREFTYDLSELSAQVESREIALRFRYFQVIEGILELPAGFEPQVLDLVARSTRPSKAEARLRVPWQLQEKLSHVGR